MADARLLLDLPFGEGDIRGALWQPLLAFRLCYRHGPLLKTLPWIKTRFPEPMTDGEAAAWIRHRYKNTRCESAWMRRWREAADAWRRPDCPVAWPYIRVSDTRSAASGISFEVQITQTVGYYQRTFGQATNGRSVALGPVLSDPATSAWTRRMRQRRGGRELLQFCRPGDHIIFYQPDRTARLVADSATLLNDVWKPQNITPHYVTLPGIDFFSSSGTLTYHGLANYAQFFSHQLSERQRHMMAMLKAAGRQAGSVPLGWKVVKEKGVKMLRPDMQQRAEMALIERLRDVEKLTWVEIGERLGGRHHWSVSKRYRVWKGFLAEGFQERPPRYQREREELGLPD